MEIEVLPKLTEVLCADFDETITETTVSFSLFCWDLSRELPWCDHCFKTSLSILGLLLLICKGQVSLHVAVEMIGVQDIPSEAIVLWSRGTLRGGQLGISVSLVGKPGCSPQAVHVQSLGYLGMRTYLLGWHSAYPQACSPSGGRIQCLISTFSCNSILLTVEEDPCAPKLGIT